MKLKGGFEADSEEYQLGEPIWITLAIQNDSDSDVYLFVPTGRSSGLQITVLEGNGAELKDMREEPDAGFVPEIKLPVGEEYRQRYLLTQWLRFVQVGRYQVRCTAEVEAYNVSLRDTGTNRVGQYIAISSVLNLTVLTPVEEKSERAN